MAASKRDFGWLNAQTCEANKKRIHSHDVIHISCHSFAYIADSIFANSATSLYLCLLTKL